MRAWNLGWSFVFLLAACSAVPRAPVRAAVALDFIADGRTTPEQCIARLGPPSSEFPAGEAGRVLTWRLGEDGQGLHPLPAPGAWFDFDRRVSLVLVFDANGRLTRQALVRAAGG